MAAGWRDEVEMTDKLFAGPGDGEWTDLGNGNRRRVILHNQALMTVEFTFEKGGIGALHSHPHVQASYIAEGRFESGMRFVGVVGFPNQQ
jgi:quercetin dioxygenase-like cupin family protein